jgi:hypothetical protein
MKQVNTPWTWMLLVTVLLAAGAVAGAAADGRWKIGGNGECVFDSTDTGPDQCSPNTPAGRWRVAGDGSCSFDASDSGPDQCTPATRTTPSAGRWKVAADGSCSFDASDSGPDQCTPATGNTSAVSSSDPGMTQREGNLQVGLAPTAERVSGYASADLSRT